MDKKTKDYILEKANELYQEGNHRDIIKLITENEEASTDYDLAFILARAYIDCCNYADDDELELAEGILLGFPEKANNGGWQYLIARCRHIEGNLVDAARHLQFAISLGGFDDIDKANELLEMCEEEIAENSLSYTDEQRSEIISYIENRFGKITTIYKDKNPLGLPIDIARIDSEENKVCIFFVTIGMGAYKMNIPPEYQKNNFERSEIQVSVLDEEIDDEVCEDVVAYIRAVAKFPFEHNVWIGNAHVFSNGKPITKLSDINASIIVDNTPSALSICNLSDEINVKFYNMFFIYSQELEYRINFGAKAMFEKIRESKNNSNLYDLQRDNSCDKPNSRYTNVLLCDEIDYSEYFNGSERCAASKNILYDGERVGYMRRFDFSDENMAKANDSGWIFISESEIANHAVDPTSIEICSLNTICNIDVQIIPYLQMPYETVIVRNRSGNFEVIQTNNLNDDDIDEKHLS